MPQPRQPPKEDTLLRALAGQAGAAVHGVQLTTALRRAREHLRVSQDEERRRIQRHLHDGLGPTKRP